MKKTIVLLLLSVMLMGGCAGMGANTTSHIDMAVEIAFVAAITAQPELKPEIVKKLTEIKSVLAMDITYQALIAGISARFGGKYEPIALLMIDCLNMDKPISEQWLTLFDAQKSAISKKIDHLIWLAG